MALFFIILLSISCFYWLLTITTCLSFFHQKLPAKDFFPPISILKAVRGFDPDLYENFLSFLQQDYPQFEILFGLMDEDDPAIPVIRKLQQEYPEKQIHLCIAPALGTNPKTSILEHLSKKAIYPLLLLTDADIRVEPNYLKKVVSTFSNPQVGLVGSIYRTIAGRSIWSKVESLLISTLLIPSGIIGFKLFGYRYAFGASIALRKEALLAIGGFSSFKDHVADDHEVARLISKAGWDVQLLPVVVENHLNESQWGEFFIRQLRWMRIAYVCRRKEYPGILLTLSLPLALLFSLLSGFSSISLWFLAVAGGARLTCAYLMAHLLEDHRMIKSLYLVFLADFLYGILWLLAPFWKRIHWKEDDYYLASDGRMIPLSKPELKEAYKI